VDVKDKRTFHGHSKTREVRFGMAKICLLWGKILESSLWITGSKETRLVWITLLAMKDMEGVVKSSVVGLADRAKVAIPECKEALRVLLAPDPEDSSKVEEGRRIREVPGGWQVVNNDLYMYASEEKREYWRRRKAAQRAKVKVGENNRDDLIRIHDTHSRNLRQERDQEAESP
jgi:hypothetical protein